MRTGTGCSPRSAKRPSSVATWQRLRGTTSKRCHGTVMCVWAGVRVPRELDADSPSHAACGVYDSARKNYFMLSSTKRQMKMLLTYSKVAVMDTPRAKPWGRRTRRTSAGSASGSSSGEPVATVADVQMRISACVASACGCVVSQHVAMSPCEGCCNLQSCHGRPPPSFALTFVPCCAQVRGPGSERTLRGVSAAPGCSRYTQGRLRVVGARW